MMLHELKVWPQFYDAVSTGAKPFEVRKNDRGFEVGDRLLLREWDPRRKSYTGRKLVCEITYKMDGGQFGVDGDFCVLGIRRSP